MPPAAVVIQFLVDHLQRYDAELGALVTELPSPIDQALVAAGFKAHRGPLAIATVTHRLAVLSKAHVLKGAANPCTDGAVRELVARARRAYAARGVRPKGKPALVREPLEALVATCDGSLRGVRDRALILFAWSSGGRRRSEVAQAVLENLQRTGRGLWDDVMVADLEASGTRRARRWRPGYSVFRRGT